NHYRERFTMGTGGYDNVVRYRSPMGQQYIKAVWCRYRDILGAPDIHFPLIGNPTGILWRGSVLSIETLRHAYFARRIVSVAPESVVEIGGGLGGQCYQAVSMGVPRYAIYDIPEVAVISGYFLLHALTERVSLYGEEPRDIQVLPHFAIED